MCLITCLHTPNTLKLHTSVYQREGHPSHCYMLVCICSVWSVSKCLKKLAKCALVLGHCPDTSTTYIDDVATVRKREN